MGRKAGLLDVGAGVDCRDGRTTPAHINAQIADPFSLNYMTQVVVPIGKRYLQMLEFNPSTSTRVYESRMPPTG